jgi:hypothetical protein
MRKEFFVRDQMDSKDAMIKTIRFMEDRGILSFDQEKIKLKEEGRFAYNMLTHMLVPLIDSYWITYVYFAMMNKDLTIEHNELIDKI